MGGATHCNRCQAELDAGSRTCARCGHALVVAEPTDPLIGRRLGDKYLVEERLGGGGMGWVYRARHEDLDRRVAIKVLNPNLASSDVLVQRFLREARAVSRLAHPNIVTLLDFGQDSVDGLLYLVMEHLEGRVLQVVLEEDWPLPLPRVLHLSQQILLAIDEAHAQGVVHRDLKPENVIVLPRRLEELVKVVDFGLASLVEKQDARLTTDGIICGTPAYLSPEQAQSAEVGPASDIYSFGVILYELCTGQLPFDAESPYVLVSRHLTEAPEPPERRAPDRDIPAEVSAAIMRCLEKDPARRFPSAMATYEALAGLVERRRSAAEREDGLRRVPTGPHRPSAHRVATGPHRPSTHRVPTGPHGPAGVTVAAAALAPTCTACGRAMPSGARFCGVCGATTQVTPPRGVSTPSTLPRPPLLGRAEPLRQIAAAGRALQGGAGAALLVCGEAGGGKTTLLEAAAEELRRQGLEVHLVRAGAHGGYQGALARATAALIGASNGNGHARLGEASPPLDAADQLALSCLLCDERPVQLAPGVAGVVCRTALRRLLQHRLTRGPVAVLVDDVGQLSACERALLPAWVEATSAAPLLLLLADERTELPELGGAALVRLALAPLAGADGLALLQALALDQPRAALEPTVAQARGNPLQLVEAALWLEEQRGSRGVGREPVTPATLTELVAARLAALDDTQRWAALVAAAVGRDLLRGLLAQLVAGAAPGGGPPVAWDAVLDTLCRRGFLEADPESPERLRLRHPRLGEIIVARAAPRELALVHDRLATLLAGGADGVAAAELGAHLARAGRDAEAADHLERAADERSACGDAEDAARLLERALQSLGRAAEMTMGGGTTPRRMDGPRRIVKLRIKLAQALNRAERPGEARDAGLQAHQLALQRGDGPLTARAAQQLARAMLGLKTPAPAESLLDEAYAVALECGDLDLAIEVACDLAEAREHNGNLDGARETLLRAWQRTRAAAQRTGGAATGRRVAELLERLGVAALRAGDAAEAVGYLRGAANEARATTDQALVAHVLGDLGAAEAAAGALSEGLESLHQAVLASQSVGDRRQTAALLQTLAQLHLTAGQPQRALSLAREAVSLSAEIGWREGQARGAVLLAQLER